MSGVGAVPQCDVLLVTVTEVETKELDRALATVCPEPDKHDGEESVYRDYGIVAGARVFQVRCAMGSSAPGGSAMVIRQALEETHASAVIMVGIAFGANPAKQKMGSILVAQQLQGYELQRVGEDPNTGQDKITLRGDRVTPSEQLLAQLKYAHIEYKKKHRRPIVFGNILSGDKLVDNRKYRDQLLRQCPTAIGGEMEGQGLYIASKDRAKWALVKAICDWADGNKSQDKRRRQRTAAKAAAEFVVFALKLGGFAKQGRQPPVQKLTVSPTPAAELLAEHCARLVQRLGRVTGLRNIAANEAGKGQGKIRLEDVFVCPGVLPEQSQRQTEEQERHLLKSKPDPGSPAGRTDHVLAAQRIRWAPERFSSEPIPVGQVLAQERHLLIEGDPGSGKSALVAALALSTASASLSDQLADAHGRPWLHGLVPFHVSLPEVAQDLAALSRTERTGFLVSCFTADLPNESINAAIEETLQSGRALILLDALDELPSRALRHAVAQTIEDLRDRFSKCALVVTTRPSGRVLIGGLTCAVLPSMPPNTATRFIERWQTALGPRDPSPTALSDIMRHLGELGRNPLMLLVVLLGEPKKLDSSERVVFYDRALKTMLTTWRDSLDAVEDLQSQRIWRAWGELALSLRHDGSGGALPRAALISSLARALAKEGIEREQAEPLAIRLIEDAVNKTGLVVNRSDQYVFWHSTFGEYMAATALARDAAPDRFLALRVDDRNLEVLVMTIDHLVHIAGRRSRAAELLDALLETREPWDDLDGSQIALATSCLLRRCFAEPRHIDRCFSILLRLCGEFPYDERHRSTFSRLARGFATHAPGPELIAELATAVADAEPRVDLDEVVPLLANSAKSNPVARTACAKILEDAARSRVQHAFAALGEARAGRLTPELFPALTEVAWFSPSYDGTPHVEDPLSPNTGRPSYSRLLSKVLGAATLRSPRWRVERIEDVGQPEHTALLHGLSLGTSAPDKALTSTLMTIATTAAQGAVRDNARGLVGRLALRHHHVRAALLAIAIESPGTPTQPNAPTHAFTNWAQTLLARASQVAEDYSSWLVEHLGRAAWTSLRERQPDLATPFLCSYLKDHPSAYPRLVEAVRGGDIEPEHSPELALYAVYLGRSRDRGGYSPLNGVPMDLWLQCIRSDDPNYRLEALECWHPSGWSQEHYPPQIIEALVEACASLVVLDEPLPAVPQWFESLRESIGHHCSSDRSNTRRRVERILGHSFRRQGAHPQQVASALHRYISSHANECSARFALLLAERDEADTSPEVTLRLETAGMNSHDLETRWRSAHWLTAHGPRPSSVTTDDLQWALLSSREGWGHIRNQHALKKLGPPSDALVERMARSDLGWTVSCSPRNWMFLNPRAADLLLVHLDKPNKGRWSDSQAYRLLLTDPENAAVDEAIYNRALASDPDSCGRLGLLIQHRNDNSFGKSEALDLGRLWIYSLDSEDPDLLLNIMRTIEGRVAFLSEPLLDKIAHATQLCLRNGSPSQRFDVADFILDRAGASAMPKPLCIAETVPARLAAMGIDPLEFQQCFDDLLDSHSDDARLCAALLLMNLDLSRERCKNTLCQLLDSTAELALTAHSHCSPRFQDFTVQRLYSLLVSRTVDHPGHLLRTLFDKAAGVDEVAELVLWADHHRPVPKRLGEALNNVGTQPDGEHRAEAPEMSRLVIDMVRSPRSHVRAEGLRSLSKAFESKPDTSAHLLHCALALIADPELVDRVLGWCLDVLKHAEHGDMEFKQIAHGLRQAMDDDTGLREQVLTWLRATLRIEAQDSPRTRAATRLMLHLGIDDAEVCQACLVAIARTQSDWRPELNQAHADYLRTHWHLLPLDSHGLLDLVSHLRYSGGSPSAETQAEIINVLLQSEDPDVRHRALSLWKKDPEQPRDTDSALAAWRQSRTLGQFRSMSETIHFAIAVLDGSNPPDDLQVFLQRAAQDPALQPDDRCRVLRALFHIPAQNAFAKASILRWIQSAHGEDLKQALWLFMGAFSIRTWFPIEAARAIASLTAEGWEDPNTQLRGSLEKLPRRPGDALLVDTSHDETFARVFAERLGDEADTLCAAFAAVASSPSECTPKHLALLLRTLRQQPSDDAPTRLARAWWHHQLQILQRETRRPPQ